MHEMANHSFLQPLKPDLIETLTICCLRSKTRQIKKDRPMDINRAEFQYFLSRVVSIGNFSSGDFIRDDSIINVDVGTKFKDRYCDFLISSVK
jgi:hypothetical protein